jgi:hypothetical protein
MTDSYEVWLKDQRDGRAALQSPLNLEAIEGLHQKWMVTVPGLRVGLDDWLSDAVEALIAEVRNLQPKKETSMEFQKADIIISAIPKRELYMNQSGTDLALCNGRGRRSPWVFVTPEEMAYVMLSASGQFQERYDAEIERLQNDKT